MNTKTTTTTKATATSKKQLTVKGEDWTAVVTGAGASGWSFKATKGSPTRRQVRRAMKRLNVAKK